MSVPPAPHNRPCYTTAPWSKSGRGRVESARGAWGGEKWAHVDLPQSFPFCI